MTWQELIPTGEALLPGRPYQEAVDLGRTAEWWRDVATSLTATERDRCERLAFDPERPNFMRERRGQS